MTIERPTTAEPPPERRWDAVCAGAIFIDLVLVGFDRWPRPGEEVFARRMRREVGGGCALTAAGLAAQGLRSAVLAIVGQAEQAEVCGRLETLGVDGSLLRPHPTEPTALTVAVSLSDDRSFFTYDGANRDLEQRLRAPDTTALLGDARHVHLACAPPPDLLTTLARRLRGAGCTVSLDAGWHERWLADPATHRALREIDLLLPNQAEARRMTGETEPARALDRLADLGVRRVALKLGARGAALLWDGEVTWADPLAVEVIDTTGAGDCFDAGLIAGLLAGEQPGRALQRACICGALSTRAMGGIEAFPSAGEVRHHLGADQAPGR